MIKGFVRFFVILLAACLVAFGMYWVVQKNPALVGANAALEGHEGRGFSGGERESFVPQESSSKGAPPEGFGGNGFRERDHDFDGGLAVLPGLAGVLRNLGIIAAFTVAVFVMKKVFDFLSRLLSRRRKPQMA